MTALEKLDFMLTQMAGGVKEGQNACSLQWAIDQLLDLRLILAKEYKL